MNYDKSINWDNSNTFDKYLEIAKNNIIRTLENQTDKNFILVFFTQHDTEENINKLKSLSDKFTIIIHNPDKGNFLESNIISDVELIATSRLDYDDFVDRECVANVHKLFKPELKVALFGINSGCTFDTKTKEAYFFSPTKYMISKTGLNAPMCTLLYNIHYMKKPITILDLGTHQNCISNFIKLKNNILRWDIDINGILNIFYYNTLGFIWTRHDLSFSKSSIIHNSTIKLDVVNEDFKNTFGIII